MLRRWLPCRLPFRSRTARRLPLRLELLEDRATPAVQPVSLANPPILADSLMGRSQRPSLSGDGQLVAFVSDSSNLVENDFNYSPDIFVRDVKTGVTRLVSVNHSGTASANASSSDPVLSADGRFVAFV